MSKDTATLGTVIVRHQGYTVLVDAAGPKPEEEELPTDLAINEQIDGGANALNVNRSHTFHPHFSPFSLLLVFPNNEGGICC